MYTKYKEYKQRQAGRRYEYFVAQNLREEGWQVDENGKYGTQDHGIDLIASKDGVKRYVQCKGWKREYEIHEDVVSHLFGSVAAMEGPDNLEGVEIYLYSPAELDSYAKAEIERLHMHYVQLNFPKWHRRHKHSYYKRRHKPYFVSTN